MRPSCYETTDCETKKKLGLFRRRDASLSEILFPDVYPEQYFPGEVVDIYTDLVTSIKTQVPFEYYSMPVCPLRIYDRKRKMPGRKNLGSRLQGHSIKPGPFNQIYTMTDKPCETMCQVRLEGTKLRFVKHLVERQYRVHLELDGLPVIMRSSELNYAVRGFPVGFRAPRSIRTPGNELLDTGLGLDWYLYNHLKFAITYHRDPDLFDGIRITGFDVHPVSIAHQPPDDSGAPRPRRAPYEDYNQPETSTCHGMDVENDPSRYLSLSPETGDSVDVIYSFDIAWIESDNSLWADRWDVYMIGAPDDDIYYYGMMNSLVIILILNAVVAIIMIRALRKGKVSQASEEASRDACNLLGTSSAEDPRAEEEHPSEASAEEAHEEEEEEEKQPGWKVPHGEVFIAVIRDDAQHEKTGWKALRGDVFRPPDYSPMLLSVLVGTGAQIGLAAVIAMALAVFKITNPMRRGQILTSLLLAYVVCGPVAGYLSARIYDFCRGASNSDRSKSSSSEWASGETAMSAPRAALILFMFGIFQPLFGMPPATAIAISMALAVLWAMSVIGASGIEEFRQLSKWKSDTVATATVLPGMFLGAYSILNILLDFTGAATAVGFGTIAALLFLWLTFNVPMVYAGAYFGRKAPSIEVPTQTNPTARDIPKDPRWCRNLVINLCLSVLSFWVVGVEPFTILCTLWFSQYNYAMVSILVTLLSLGVVCGQISIFSCYMQLAAENHRWWWTSFRMGSIIGLYSLLYSLWFMSAQMDLVGVLSVVIYVTYMTMISICIGLFGGSIGFLSSLWFVRTIYGAVAK